MLMRPSVVVELGIIAEPQCFRAAVELGLGEGEVVKSTARLVRHGDDLPTTGMIRMVVGAQPETRNSGNPIAAVAGTGITRHCYARMCGPIRQRNPPLRAVHMGAANDVRRTPALILWPTGASGTLRYEV